MRHLTMGALALGLMVGMAAPAAAEVGAGIITGKVVGQDSSRHELTIREEGSQQMRTFKVLNPDVLATLKNGDRVQVNAADEIAAQAAAR